MPTNDSMREESESESVEGLPVIHVEVVQRASSRLPPAEVSVAAARWLQSLAALSVGAALAVPADDAPALSAHVEALTLCDAGHKAGAEYPPSAVRLVYHVHTLDEQGAQRDALGDGEGGEEGAGAAGCEVWALPSRALHGLWESLVFEGGLKLELLRLVQTALALHRAGVDERQVPSSRVVVLHGPPGTGKTSLCRALAHKLAVRLQPAFPRARLIDVDAHSLFSRWFSESGKLVTGLFARIQDLADDPKLLTIVLIDEVESLAAARRAALAGLEPSDAIRAVNALLTALDRLKRAPNVLVLATSNVTQAIDGAFLDRADLVRLVPPPGPRAAYEILRGAAGELMARGVVAPREPLFPWRVLHAAGWAPGPGARASLRLWEVAERAGGGGGHAPLSARALRRLPLLALSLQCPPPPPPPTLRQLTAALGRALDDYRRDGGDLLREQGGQCGTTAPTPAVNGGAAGGGE